MATSFSVIMTLLLVHEPTVCSPCQTIGNSVLKDLSKDFRQLQLIQDVAAKVCL